MAAKRKYPRQAPRAGAGRPKVLPADARPHWWRCTPVEAEQIREFLKKIRQQKTLENKGETTISE